MDEKIHDLVIDRIDSFRDEAKDAITDLKDFTMTLSKDINYRFDMLDKTISRLSEKIDTEHSVNIEQNVKIDNIEKKVDLIQESGNHRLNNLEKDNKTTVKYIEKLKILWATIGFLGISVGGIVIKMIFSKI